MSKLEKITKEINDIVREINFYLSQKGNKSFPYILHLKLVKLSYKKLQLEKELKVYGKLNNIK